MKSRMKSPIYLLPGVVEALDFDETGIDSGGKCDLLPPP